MKLANWKAALGLASALLATSLFTGNVQAAELKTLRVSIIPIIDVSPLMVAMKQGYFAEEGFEIDTTPTAGGAAGIPGLVGGAFDIAFGNVVSSILAVQQGLDIKVIAAGTKTPPVDPVSAGMVARKADGIDKGAELHGKTIAVNTRNNVIWLYARAWVKARGGDPEKVTYKEVPFPQMIDAVKRKQVDVAFMVDPFRTAALTDPELALVGSPYVEVQPGVEVGQYVTTSKFAAENPEIVASFTRALRKGIEWYNANMENPELFEVVSKLTRIPPDVIKTLPMQQAPLKIDVEQVKKTMALMQEHGLLKEQIDTSTFMHPAAL